MCSMYVLRLCDSSHNFPLYPFFPCCFPSGSGLVGSGLPVARGICIVGLLDYLFIRSVLMLACLLRSVLDSVYILCFRLWFLANGVFFFCFCFCSVRCISFQLFIQLPTHNPNRRVRDEPVVGGLHTQIWQGSVCGLRYHQAIG